MPRRPPRPAASTSSARVVGWIALGVALIGAATALLPLRPIPLSLNLDTSFGATLHYQAATRFSSGTRLISTFGPLGFAYYPIYLPATFGWLVLVQGVLGATLGWGLAWLGWTAWGSPWGAALAVGACAPLLGLVDVRFWMLPLLAVLIELVDGRRAPLALRLAIGAALGLIGLIKVTFLTASLIALGPLALWEVVYDRRPPLMAVSAALTMTIAWLALGLGWGDWLAYLDWSAREITPGYSEAMQVQSTTGLVAHAVVVSLAASVAGALLIRQRGGRGWPLPALALTGLLFLLFKAGFVRADVHVLITSYGLLLYGVLLALLWDSAPARVGLGALLLAVLPGTLLWHARVSYAPPAHALFRVVTPAEMLSRLGDIPALVGGERLATAHAQQAAKMRATVPLPLSRLPGSFDIYSFQQNLLLAYGVEFRPRPVFQSYMAYTPRLARANAESLAGDRAPQWILFQLAPLDGRFPSLDDAAVWPELLARYQPADAVGPFAVLQRRPTPVPWRVVPVDRLATTTDTPIAVPRGLLWARIDVHETFADRLIATVFAGPYVYVDVALADRTAWRFRLVPAIARDGFLLSPLIATTQDLIVLMQRGADALANHAIMQLRLHVDSPLGHPAGPRAVDVEFLQLQFGG